MSYNLKTGMNIFKESHLFNKTILISIGVHLKTIGGFAFTISSYLNIIASFRILSVITIPTFSFA
jgi:hypothetical protein